MYLAYCMVYIIFYAAIVVIYFIICNTDIETIFVKN